MRLPVPIRELFEWPTHELAAHMPPADDPSWRLDARQRRSAVHEDTRSILFTWLPNDWTPGGERRVVSYRYAPAALTDAAQACGTALAEFFGGQVVKLMLVELRAGGAIAGHIDASLALRLAHRCHVPVVTNDGVEFRIDDVPHSLREGCAYEIDNTRFHAVTNHGTTPRVHLICDVMPWTDPAPALESR
jgi:hypothetical protein